MKSVTTKQIREKLTEAFGSNVTLSVRKGIYTAKRSYFWGVTNSGESFAQNVMSTLKPLPVSLVDFGNHYHSFVGSARTGSRQDSYFWVKFTTVSA